MGGGNQIPSDQWSYDFIEQKQKEQQNKSWAEQMKPDMTMKQMGNKIKMTAESTKNNIMGFEDSLIWTLYAAFIKQNTTQ